MSEKVGLLGALNILGMNSEQSLLGEGALKITAMMLCIQGAGERKVEGKSYPMSSGVALLIPTLQLDQNVHELWVGTAYFKIEERYLDTEKNQIGKGLAGLATDGGFDRNEYGKSIGHIDRRDK